MEIKYVKGLDRILKTEMVQSYFLDFFFFLSLQVFMDMREWHVLRSLT